MILDDAYISYVNLDSRTDRRARTEETLAAAGIKAERTAGGRLADTYRAPTRFKKMLDLTPGTVGCWLGQTDAMAEALRRGQHAFVMEDDLVLCSDFQDRLAVIEDFLSRHPWDVFWFGGTYHVNPPVWHKDDRGRDVELTDHPRIVRAYGCWSTYAYLVNRDSVGKILELLDWSMDESIGIDTSFIALEPMLHTYAFVPGCAKQYDNWSDITHSVSAFSGFGRLGPYWWQDRAEDFDPSTFDWAEARV